MSTPNPKSPYAKDPSLRKKEIKVSNSQSVNPRSAEEAIEYHIGKLTQPKQPFSANDTLNRLAELEEITAELVAQQGIDLSATSSYSQVAFDRWNQKRQNDYNAIINTDWQRTVQRYESTGQFFIDLGDCKVYPTTIDPATGKEYTKFGCRPTPERIGGCLSFNIEDAKAAERDTAELLKGQNKFTHITIDFLHKFEWDGQFYSRAVEPLYGAFHLEIARRLDTFKQEHGTLTPRMVIKQSDARYHCYSDGDLMVGYRIELKTDKK